MAKLFQFLIFCVFLTNSISLNMSIVFAFHSCPPEQARSLLKLKDNLHIDTTSKEPCRKQIGMGYYESLSSYCDSYNIPIMEPKIYSWNRSTDCCIWEGVTCDEFTGNVIELDLSGNQLAGVIDSNSSIFQLSHLKKLNLAYNSLYGSEISPIFRRLTHLTHLNLTESGWQGKVSSEVSQLQGLVSLDLSKNGGLILEPYVFKVLLQNLTRISVLSLGYVNISSSLPNNLSSSLTVIDLDYTNLKGTFPNHLFHLPNLQQLSLGWNTFDDFSSLVTIKWNTTSPLQRLELDHCEFPKKLLDTIGNLKHLTYLDLSFCHLNGTLPQSFGNLTQLDHLDLFVNQFSGQIPPEIIGLEHLTYLDIGSNNLDTAIPKSFSNLVNLEYLSLASNNLSGHIEIDAISNFVNLTILDMSSNNLSGTLDFKFLSRLKWMDLLDLSFNSLTLTNENNITLPVVSIDYLLLASCNIRDLDVLRSIVVQSVVSLPNSNIHGEIPEWVLSSWANVTVIDLSNNYITHIGSITQLQSLLILDLRSNLLRGELPALPRSILNLYLSNNQFHGEIKPSICNLTGLSRLDLSNNNFNGAFPHCFGMMPLEILDLHMNNLKGTIPNTFSMNQLVRLNLRGNHLEGEVPRSLINCSRLEVFDLSENYLSDKFPTWLGDLPYLQVLSLRYNKFYGPISPHNASPDDFSQLQIFDLSYNQLSGSLPASLFLRFREMMNEDGRQVMDKYISGPSYFGDRSEFYFGNENLFEFRGDYYDSVAMVLNGNIMELERIFSDMWIIDLSSNQLEGQIPNSIGGLFAIQRLNLSHNKFTGQIPPQLGNLSNLQSLDLSSNELDGNIPDQLASLVFLGMMNLSYNHLTGRIPSGQQLQTFQNNSYIGNDGLCGYPLSRNCGNDNPQVGISDTEDDEEFFDGFTWQSVLVGYGVGVCVGLVLGSLMLSTEKPKWLIRIVKEEANKVIYRYKSRNGISQTWFKRS